MTLPLRSVCQSIAPNLSMHETSAQLLLALCLQRVLADERGLLDAVSQQLNVPLDPATSS